MDIRAATPDDARRISALLRDLTGKYIAHEFSEEGAGRLLESMNEAAIKSYLESGYRYHLAEENGELAGVVAIRDNCHLYHLFVSERFQGRGLARRLWEVAKAVCLDAGNPGVFTVNSSRYAVGLYEKFGFVRQSEAVDISGVISIPMKLESAIRE
ncbi:GCN5-related N-acetyltransferase [Methylocaldum marinum]|uniref:GCN5-related N-acetyltransferase n=1 Tax=Methylocaldum marinum TaxID=1432792 RepID=A0A250KQ48_9GAMM|nr:GNAT family N-acetyltransferase [Methylocaldum marinum]BBA33717.1 GCN5-related N-acetyltransferase [Methylocaldum marinum]